MKKRKLIYTDASYYKDKTTIALYDKHINRGFVLKVNNKKFKIKSNYDSEMLAVIHAVIYVQKKNYKKYYILTDSKAVADSKTALKLKERFGVNISWLPREANEIADQLSRLKKNTSRENINLLRFVYELIVNNTNKR